MKPKGGPGPGYAGAGVSASALVPPDLDATASLPGARDWVRTSVRNARSSFFWAMRLLPAERRAAMFALYAFCRTIDDIADGAAAKEAKTVQLSAWRGEIAALYAGTPGHPATIALAGHVARYALAKTDFLDVIDGMEMDVAGRMVAPSLQDLTLYCARAACAVGRLSARVFGLPQAEGRALARALGQAMQLTNVLRDLAEDAALGRLYLPSEILDYHGIAAREPAAVLAHPKVTGACADVSAMAEEHYGVARALLAGCAKGGARPARVMCGIYARLLARLKERGFAPEHIAHPVRIGLAEKVLIVTGACLR